MKPLGDRLTHLRLVCGMAKATDTDLAKAYASGALSPDSWAGMVERCRGCACATTCASRLHKGPRWQDAPGICRNRTVLASLKSAQQDVPAR